MRIEKNQYAISDDVLNRIFDEPGFGKYYTDHMVQIDWTKSESWHEARVQPYAPLSLDPATSVMHYGQAIFEGLKAFRHPDGSVYAFRPDKNAERFMKSAIRLEMPVLPVDLFLDSLKSFLSVDGRWVSSKPEQSLYIRPFMIATEVGLGVRPSSQYSFFIIASPVGPYFPQGIKPVSVWISTDYVRAAPGGTGEAKCAGNYAASLIAQAQAAEQGCDQVIWIDAIERKWIEEMGGMNLFFVYGNKIVTPRLTGTLLRGVTRDSILSLAGDLGYETDEVMISVDELILDLQSGVITEAFACGTAAAITPIGTIKSEKGTWKVSNGEPGAITLNLREALIGIQTGAIADTHQWMWKISE
ncbi:MAG: branched-chain amino acid aminotransferase [Candidatus Nanopelagicales bacterium]